MENKEYDCGQWIKCGPNYGIVIARSLGERGLDCVAGYESDPTISGMAARGQGYCVQWVDLIGDPPTTWTPRSKRWIAKATIGDKRYGACKSPCTATTELEPEQTALPLDDHASLVAFLKAAATAGRFAEDKLRAMGEAA